MGLWEEQIDAPSEQSGPGWTGQVYGACPVQGIGTVGGDRWYFRARHGGWSMEIWEGAGEVPDCEREPVAAWEGNDPWHGWMPFSKVWEIVRRCLRERGQREVRISAAEDGYRYRVFIGPNEVIDAVAPTAMEALRIAAVR